MAKKSKQVKEVKEKEQLTLDGLKSGMVIKDLHYEDIIIDNNLIEQMRQYEQETNKSVLWRGKITGRFIFFKYYKEHPEEKSKTKKKPGRKPKNVEELIEEEVVNEENLMLDAIADYKAEYNVSKVNVNTKKFKAFFEEWKKSE